MGGKGRGLICPRAHVFPFKPCHTHFLSNTRMCVRTSAHSHTHLSVHKQTHKGKKRERCRVQSEEKGGGVDIERAAKEEGVLQRGNPDQMLLLFCSGREEEIER